MTAFLVGLFIGFALGLGYPKILKAVKKKDKIPAEQFRKGQRTMGRGGQ